MVPSAPALSVLDLSPVPSGTTAAGALQNKVDLARHADARGLARYWLAEHHNAGGLASSSPEVVIASVAAVTKRIRVGSGGIMLPNQSALKVAETFRALHALHPGRIDLGVGRAAGTDNKTALALRRSRELLGADRFPEQLGELVGLLTSDPDPFVRFGPLKAAPTGGRLRPVVRAYAEGTAPAASADGGSPDAPDPQVDAAEADTSPAPVPPPTSFEVASGLSDTLMLAYPAGTDELTMNGTGTFSPF